MRPIFAAIDGKVLRGSFDAFHDRRAAQVMSAFDTDGRIILGHMAVTDKSNEIPVAQALIEALGLRGRLFTLDAMHCQKNLRSRKAHGKPCPGATEGEPAGADSDRGRIHDPNDTDTSCTEGRNRQEWRTADVFAAKNLLAGTGWQDHVETIVRITRRTLCRSRATGLWKQRTETAFYLSSTAGLSANQWNWVVRRHWSIENHNHHVRDVACREDESRIRTNPGIMARIRSTALNILRANHVANIAQALWNNALSLDKTLNYKAL